MADRNLQIHINAEAAGLQRGVLNAEASLNRLRGSHAAAWQAINQTEKWLQNEADQALREVEQRQQARTQAIQTTGTVMATAGAAMAAGLGLATREAIRWESDWAGVAKVLDATPGQMAVLEDQIRGLALEMPVASTEIAGVAAAAAQLGVENKNLVAFTRTAVQLGVATDLAAQDAAMGLSRLMNVMGTSQDQIGRVGSSIVELGNNFAAMESEILEMSLRLSGMGNQIGLAEGEVMGLAAALTSVGIQAELGGGAFSRAMSRVQSAVKAGGERLEEFGQVAGMSADEFAEAFEDRPNEAIVAFLRGLDDINSSGGDVYATLNQLGLTGTEIADVMTRASASWDQVAEAMDTGNQGFADGNALLEEAADRFATTESKVTMAGNSIKYMAQDLGETFLPMVGDAAEKVSGLNSAFGDLPEPVQTGAAALGGVAAAATLAGGAFILAVPKAAEFRAALDTMGPRTQAVGRGLSSVVGLLGGPWGIAVAAAVAVGATWANQQAEQAARINTLADALKMSNGLIDDNVRLTAVKTLQDEGALDLARDLGIDLQLVTDAYLGNAEATATLNKELARLTEEGTVTQDTLLGTREYLDGTGQAAESLSYTMDELSGDMDGATQEAQNQAEAMGQTQGATQGAAGASNGLAGSQQGLAGDLSETNREVQDLKQSLDSLTSTTTDAASAEIGYRDAVDAATDSVAQNGAGLDLNTEAGRRNTEALLRLRDRSNEYTQSVYSQTGSVEKAMEAHQEARKDFIDTAKEMGATADEAEKLADKYLGIPSEVETQLEVNATGRWTATSGHPGWGGNDITGGFAGGGEVEGPGTGTSDSIPAWLSNGEHVVTAQEVEQVGGQDAMYRLRAAIRAGYVRFAVGGGVGDPESHRSAQALAKGGEVRDAPTVISDHREDVRINLQKLYSALIDGVGSYMGQEWKKYVNSGGPVVAAAKSQLGMPYSWGGGGPHGPSKGFGRGAGTVGFDCSSLMQYAWYQGAGVMLPRVTYSQINTGSPVSKGNEIPGDLVFPHRGHVTMVAAPGKLIHAPYTGAHVSYRSMYPSPLAIRRPRRRYDDGGVWFPGEDGENRSGAPERVLDPRQTRAFERLVDDFLSRPEALSSARGGDGARQPVVVHINHVPGYSTVEDVTRALGHAQRRTRLGRPG